MGCCGSRPRGEFTIPPLSEQNTYPRSKVANQDEQEQIKNIVDNIAPHQSFQNFQNLGTYIYKSKNKRFEDPKFMSNTPRSDWQYLQTLRNQKNSEVYRKYETRIDSLKQSQLQFCYLTSVFYEICKNEQLKRQIFITQRITQQRAFILRLFCNGKLTNVIIDEKVPVSSGDNLSYLDLLRGKEIWPYLLEKSWCKQIGSYKKAVGLSPQDAFEEITGIPAYSYEIQFLEDDEIEDVIKRKENWIIFTAKIGTSSLIRTRQIFYLEEAKNQKYYLRSPYFAYTYERQERGGSRIVMSLQKLREYFQFMTVGYVCPGYITKSVPVKSKKRQEVFFELQVVKEENINVRFSQFYDEYFQDLEEKSGYDYSPVFMDLYDQSWQLVDTCEGCPKSVEGNRCSHLTQQIFVNLRPSKYFLKVQVDWLNDLALNEGNILIYASEGNVKVKKPSDPILRSRILAQNFREEELINNDPDNEIKLNVVERKYKYILQIINTTHKDVMCEVTMNGADNIRIRNKDIRNFKFRQKLKAKQISILEVLPEDPKQSFYLPSITVKKV